MRTRAFLLSSLLIGVIPGLPTHAEEAVSVGPFRNVELRGGGHVVLRRGPEQHVTLVRGSSRFTRMHVNGDGQLVIDACDTDCPSHYDLEIDIVTPRIDGIAISGGGKIESERGFGREESVAAAVEGGGHIDIRSIDAGHADAAVNGGGHIDLRVEGQLEAAVDGGGHIAYWGNPAVTSAVNGGGSVTRGG